MGTSGAIGVVGAFGAVIVLALGGPVWAVGWLVLVVVAGVVLRRVHTRRRDRLDA